MKETAPDMPIDRVAPLASGHSCEFPLGRRAVIPGKMLAHAMAPATGFVSTAADLARFFNQLSPGAKRSILSAESRREMTRRHWRNPDTTLEGYYGLGIISGNVRRLDLVRPLRRDAGLHHPHVNVVEPRRDDLRADQRYRRLGRLLDGQPGSASCARSSATAHRRVRSATGRGAGATVWRAVDLRADGKQGTGGSAPSALFPFTNVGELRVEQA